MSDQSFCSSIQPLLDRVGAAAIREQDGVITAMVYQKTYTFKLDGLNVKFFRDGLESYFTLPEVQALDHICMPHVVLVRDHEIRSALAEQKASDIAMRLHLIMPGDICLSTEMVIYLGAGTQRSSNYIRAR